MLADNDIVLKLAQCDLFEEFLVAFGVSTAQVFIVKAARNSIRSKGNPRRIGEPGAVRLEQFLATVSDLVTPPHPGFEAALTEQVGNGIHEGEAVLFATCPVINGSIIITGDKQCLIGLKAAAVEDEVCAKLFEALAGRVYCFEQVITRILKNSGFDNVLDKLRAGRGCDTGLALWLGHGLDASEANFRAGMGSFLAEARRTSGLLLAPD